jgi:hypothetical protein
MLLLEIAGNQYGIIEDGFPQYFHVFDVAYLSLLVRYFVQCIYGVFESLGHDVYAPMAAE